MKGNKIIATLVVLTMVLSTLVVLKQFNVLEEASAATPGVTMWGYPNQTITPDLKYHPTNTVTVKINTTGLATTQNYILYYPDYTSTKVSGVYNSFNLTWKQKGDDIYTTGTSVGEDYPLSISGITLNVSGLWVLSETGTTPDGSDANFADTIAKWFWVNTSDVYSLSVTPDQVYFGNNETINVEVTNGGTAVSSATVDIRRELTDDPITGFPTRTPSSGNVSFSSNYINVLTYAGNYTVIAYRDSDNTDTEFLYTYTNGYNQTLGNASYEIDPETDGADYYSYAKCGPWDPPEYNSTYYSPKLIVNAGVPSATIPAANQSMYWSFEGQVNITVKDYEDDNISGLQVAVYDSEGNNWTSDISDVDTSHSGDGWIWLTDGSWDFVDNQTLTVYIFKDIATQDGTQEWNTSIDFQITNAPGVQWKWISDDGGLGTSNDGVIPWVPERDDQPLDIQFQIINDEHHYYGEDYDDDAVAEYGENISISGNALFLPTTLDKIPNMVDFDGETWTVSLTPTMALNGGEITFTVDWEDYGSLTETLTIGGSELNGTIVTISPASFTYGTNTTLTVTVKDANGDPIKYANEVGLYWVCWHGYLLEDHPIAKKTKGNANGEYTFIINTTQQMDNQTDAFDVMDDPGIKAPRNISAYADTGSGYGYALTEMKPVSDLKVTVEPGTVMAAQKITKIWFNTTVVNSAGNRTGWPEDAALHVRIFNSTGEDVTGLTVGTISTGDLDEDTNISLTSEYLWLPGTYTVYVYNNTHNSEGHNATLVVQAVDVTCDVSEFIWNVDDNISATFTVKYNGALMNGTLRIDNITDQGDYNGTWYNSSFTVVNGVGTDEGGNESLSVTVTNGVKTIHNITALNLPTGEDRENITYYFKPKGTSYWAQATGITPVKIANVAVTPTVVVLNEAADLTVTITGRGAGLNDVWVSIGGAADEQNGTTTSDGTITFSVVPSKTGKITIAVENRTSDTTVQVTNWKLYIDSPAQVNEDESFTITIKNGTSSGSALANAYVTFNKETKQTTADGKATFTATTVGANGAVMTIAATADGYKEASATIQINNVPKLIIAVSGEVKAGQTFTLTIADDMGGPVIGATVTFEGKTYTTGAGGTITMTAPTTEGSYPVSATFPGFTSVSGTVTIVKGGGIPGFELLTLVAAIGVAFLLLRRRRN